MDEDSLRDLHDLLAATGERPVERTASRWLGEAEAIAGDIAHGNVDAAVRRERLEKIDHLLENVESTGDDDADDHVAEAKAIVERVLGDE